MCRRRARAPAGEVSQSGFLGESPQRRLRQSDGAEVLRRIEVVLPRLVNHAQQMAPTGVRVRNDTVYPPQLQGCGLALVVDAENALLFQSVCHHGGSPRIRFTLSAFLAKP